MAKTIHKDGKWTIELSESEAYYLGQVCNRAESLNIEIDTEININLFTEEEREIASELRMILPMNLIGNKT